MKRLLVASLLLLAVAPAAEAGRVRVVRPGRRAVVHVHTGFPLHRALPHVYVRAPRTVVRVTPRVFLPSVAFGAVVVPAPPAPELRVWHDAEVLDRDEGWTEFTLNVDRRGTRLLLDVDKGPAQISFAEVVFENGDTQLVDFNDKIHARGTYTLLDFKDGRKVDHVRIVAKADGNSARIGLALLS